MVKIKSVRGREILDSRGNPTVEVDIALSDESFGRASVPSGASTGSHEAVELRDGNRERYGGKGVQKAVENVNSIIAKAVIGHEFDQESLDNKLVELDGTSNKSSIGANAILGVSLAFAKASAVANKQPLYQYFSSLMDNSHIKYSLPVPMMNIINGGKHAENSTDIQELMIVPHGFDSFKRALQAGSEVFYALKSMLHDRKLSTTVGDEGGFAPQLESNEAAIKLIIEAIDKAGYKLGKDISLALDVAATEIYRDGMYHLEKDGKTFATEEMIGWYEGLVARYPIISIEDGLSEDDWDGYVIMTNQLKNIQIVGDDLFVTNIDRLSRGIEKKVANAILIKLNQIGTVTETIRAIKLARKANYKVIISHRSGETEDATISDFAVGTDSGEIKTGSLSRTDRVAKYNQLLRIEEELDGKAPFATPFGK